jgi:NitT/TauT family transport system ATP-binding protein
VDWPFGEPVSQIAGRHRRGTFRRDFLEGGPGGTSNSYAIQLEMHKFRSNQSRLAARVAEDARTVCSPTLLPRSPVLAFHSVSKVFPDGTAALQEISFETDTCSLTSIVGPSGCGKSTLLRIAAGLTEPSTGHVQTAGRLGFVFQDATLLPWRTVRRNVELLGELHRLPREETVRRAAEAINLVGLQDFVNHFPIALSGGMRMRVSLARALTMKPDLFLFDEPFGALDEITRERLNEELLQLLQLQGFSGLLVTHSVYEAVYLSSRVLVMSKRPGKIVGDVKIPFAYPRAPELRFDAEFAEIAGKISKLLRVASP